MFDTGFIIMLRFNRLAVYAVVWLAAGLLLDRTGTIPFSKNLWSLSFCFGMSGVTSLLWVMLYVVDPHGPLHGGHNVFFNTHVRSILTVLWHFKGTG